MLSIFSCLSGSVNGPQAYPVIDSQRRDDCGYDLTNGASAALAPVEIALRAVRVSRVKRAAKGEMTMADYGCDLASGATVGPSLCHFQTCFSKCPRNWRTRGYLVAWTKTKLKLVLI